MAQSPFREQRLSAAEVRRVVTRAIELAPLHDPAAASGQALTRGELEQRAAELGIPLAAVRHALESPSSARLASVPAASGARVVLDEQIDGELTVDGHEQIAEALQAALEGHPGRLDVVGRKLTYRATVYNAVVTILVHTKAGRTRLLVENGGQPKWLVVLTASALAPLALLPTTAVFGLTSSTAWSVIAGVAAVIAAYLMVRGLFARSARKRDAVVERAASAMRAAVGQAVTQPARAGRIDVAARVPLAIVPDVEAEAEADADAALADKVIGRVRR